MPIPQDETGLPLVTAIDIATRRRVHLSTALRWCQRRNKYGVRLQSWMIGGRRVTSVEAVHRYNEANTIAAQRRDSGIPSSTSAQRSKAHSDAQRELDQEFAK